MLFMYGVSVFLPLVDVCPGGHHVVVDMFDLVRVVVSVQCQQFVRQRVGFIHLTLPLLQILHKELQREEGKEEERKSRERDSIYKEVICKLKPILK